MKKYLKAIIYILFPLIMGGIIGVLFNNRTNFETIIKPVFAPPGIVFPIVWSILYLLMGISSCLIYKSNDLEKTSALNTYFLQLIFNFLWTPIFFGLKLYLIGTIWVFIMIILVISMIRKFYRINKISAYLQIPYLIWLFFAFVLSFSIFLLNR